MVLIKAKDNEKLKLLGKLSSKKWRDKLDLFVVEGERAIMQIVENKFELNIVFISEKYMNNQNYLEIGKFAKEVVFVDSKLYEEIADTQNSQGVIAICPIPRVKLSDFFDAQKSRVIMIDKVQDPGNLGTIIRTAEAAGYDAVVCIKGTTDAFSQKVTRSTVGANTSIDIIFIEEEDILEFKKNGYKIITTSLSDDSIDYRKPIYENKFVIVVGNEGDGVSEFVLSISDIKIIIPIWGNIESLNVGVATSIVLYESRRLEDINE